ncbi:hypothetical protein AAFF_G00288330 [Aldrovandia affinis]|uniref:Uncharacterized protein n=1 Tax=Aldrovandia affinis TaxID=143900 RepID=A0AAD7WS21_9TELE|nr:hypothetical protein AAFF_G00288330 [Aldrovandia affinis]
MQIVGLIHTLEQCLNRMQTVGLIHTLEQCLNRMMGLIHTLEQCLNRMQIGSIRAREICTVGYWLFVSMDTNGRDGGGEEAGLA